MSPAPRAKRNSPRGTLYRLLKKHDLNSADFGLHRAITMSALHLKNWELRSSFLRRERMRLSCGKAGLTAKTVDRLQGKVVGASLRARRWLDAVDGAHGARPTPHAAVSTTFSPSHSLLCKPVEQILGAIAENKTPGGYAVRSARFHTLTKQSSRGYSRCSRGYGGTNGFDMLYLVRRELCPLAVTDHAGFDQNSFTPPRGDWPHTRACRSNFFMVFSINQARLRQRLAIR